MFFMKHLDLLKNFFPAWKTVKDKKTEASS